MSNSDDTANTRITAIWERFAIGLLSVVMGLGLMVVQDLRTQVKETESRVLFLYTDKVSNQQLKDTEQRLVTNIEGMRSDLLARLDLYFGALSKKKQFGGPMIWKILDRAGTLAYLLLSTILITILMANSSENAGVNNYGQKLELTKQDILMVLSNNTGYLETRLNGVSERQDTYQVTMDQRVYILEQRVKELQADKKQAQRVINNNINTLTNN